MRDLFMRTADDTVANNMLDTAKIISFEKPINFNIKDKNVEEYYYIMQKKLVNISLYIMNIRIAL